MESPHLRTALRTKALQDYRNLVRPSMATNTGTAKQSWNSGLYNCTSDWSSCCYGTWCLPCLYGENTSKLHGGGCFGPCCLYYCCTMFACFFAGSNRTDLRNKHTLQEDPCSDMCVHCWCSPCAVCQEAREHKAQAAKGPTHQAMAAPGAQKMV